MRRGMGRMHREDEGMEGTEGRRERVDGVGNPVSTTDAALIFSYSWVSVFFPFPVSGWLLWLRRASIHARSTCSHRR